MEFTKQNFANMNKRRNKVKKKNSAAEPKLPLAIHFRELVFEDVCRDLFHQVRRQLPVMPQDLNDPVDVHAGMELHASFRQVFLGALLPVQDDDGIGDGHARCRFSSRHP
jgi:hypothetical protein